MTAAGQRATATGRHRRRLTFAAGIILAILAIEVAGGLLTGSLALLADAGHMATDAAGIGLSLLAAHFATRPPTMQRTFGYARAEILAATLNALLLFAVAAFILVESIRRLITPPTVTPGLMIVFGVIALAGTSAAALLLGHGQAESLNVRGAFIEVVSDALGAAAVIAAGIVIAVTGFTRADAIASLAIGALILPRTWRLLRDAINVLLEATPKDVDLDDVRRHLTELDGVAPPPDRTRRRPRRARPARVDDHVGDTGAFGPCGRGTGRARERTRRAHARRAAGMPARSFRRRALHVPARARRARRPRAVHLHLRPAGGRARQVRKR